MRMVNWYEMKRKSQIFLMIFFLNIVPNLGITTEHEFFNTTNISHNPIENAI